MTITDQTKTLWTSTQFKTVNTYMHTQIQKRLKKYTQAHTRTHTRAYIPGESRPVGEMPLFVDGDAVPFNLLSCMQAGFSSSEGDKPPEE